ncbi:DUF927 domain-containing protein [Desulfobaculum bizertense]|uniref:Uncharacterized protein n=1 Tax=Desulfobaculum bizertense DSM 18034 TaxID=1121442 RepID=A0A1T4VYA0_9BACT|nr:DUF927 domain-containing protein [Desulfobaculum bizertense]SKA69984.1 protein of unknown function [Desulfobaculum bizertense DSM 18034]
MQGKKQWFRFVRGVREGEKFQMLIRDQEEDLEEFSKVFPSLDVFPFAIQYDEAMVNERSAKFAVRLKDISLPPHFTRSVFSMLGRKIKINGFWIPFERLSQDDICGKICDLFCISKKNVFLSKYGDIQWLFLNCQSLGKEKFLELPYESYIGLLSKIRKPLSYAKIRVKSFDTLFKIKNWNWIAVDDFKESQKNCTGACKASLLDKYFNFYDELPTCFYWGYAAQNKLDLSEEQIAGVLRSFGSLKEGWRFFNKNGVASYLGAPAEKWNRRFQKALQAAEKKGKEGAWAIRCEELFALFHGVECDQKCNVTTPVYKCDPMGVIYNFYKYFSKPNKESTTAQLLKVSSVLSVSLLKFADGKIGRLVSFHDFDGCIKECPLTIRDLHGKRFVEKLEESGLGIMNTPENVRLLRYKILNGPCDGTAFSVRKTGWNTVNDENVFVTAYGCYPTPSCKIIPQIPGGIVYPHTCLSKSHLPQLSFLRELPPSAQSFVHFLFSVMACGPLLNSIPKSHAFYHIYGLSDECATFWAEFMGMFSSVGNPLPASWYFSDFMKKKKSLFAYQDATVVFKPLGASEHRCYRNFVNKVCSSRRAFTLYNWRIVQVVRDPGPEDELRIAALSFGKEAVCGMSPQEKKLEYVGTKKDVYLENIKASEEMEYWFQENEKQCREILRMWRPYRGLFYQQLVEELFSDGEKKLLDGEYCPYTDALERRGKELVATVQTLQEYRAMENRMQIPVIFSIFVPMSEIGIEDLEPCDEKLEKFLKKVQEKVAKLHKGFKPHEIVYQKKFCFLMCKRAYCYFDRGEIFTKKFRREVEFKSFCEYLKKEKILVFAKGKNTVSTRIPRTNVGTQSAPRVIGGDNFSGYALRYKKLREWKPKNVSPGSVLSESRQGGPFC